MSLVDIFVIFILFTSLIFGFFRGFVKELLSVIAWVIAFFISYYLTSSVAVMLPFEVEFSIKYIISFVIIFVLVLFNFIYYLRRSLWLIGLNEYKAASPLFSWLLFTCLASMV